MKARLILATSWVMAEPARLQAILVGGFVLMGALVGFAHPGVALADGTAPGGSR